MCRVGVCSLSPSLASFHVSHMCSLLLFLNAEAKVKNECWRLFELGYRFLSLPEANLHGVQFSFFIFMLAQHFMFHFFAVCFQHFSEYIWRRHWLFSFSGSFHFSLFGMVGSEKRQFVFTFVHCFSLFSLPLLVCVFLTENSLFSGSKMSHEKAVVTGLHSPA